MVAKIMAIDPGGTTGIAIRFDNEALGTIAVPSAINIGVENVVSLILDHEPQVIITERFVTTGMLSKYGIDTIELVGCIKTLAHLAKTGSYWDFGPTKDWQPVLIRHVPSQRKPFIPKAREILKARGRPYVDHELDALAHLLCYEFHKDKEGVHAESS